MKILIVKIGAIGDVALSLPLLKYFSDDEITWVVGKGASPLLKAVQKKIRLIEVDEKKLLEGSFFEKIKEVLLCYKKLLFKKFDFVFTAHPDPRYRILSFFCFKKKHHYLKKKNFPLTSNFHGIEYLSLAGISAEKAKEEDLYSFFKIAEEKGVQSRKIALYPGGSYLMEGKGLRKWPIQNYVKLAQKLIASNYEVLLIGSEEDLWTESFFKELELKNYIGKTSLVELLEVLKGCIGLISHDAGPLHLARLTDCKILGLFGPTSPRSFMQEKESTLYGGDGLNCRPCYTGKSFPKCNTNACMKQITVESVLSKLKENWQLKLNEDSNSPRLVILDIGSREGCRSDL